MVHETVKIHARPEREGDRTCVRVPVFYGHSESVNIETERKLSAKEARAILAQAPGVQVYDNPSEKMYPLAVDAAGEDATYVGRIREDDTIPNGSTCGLSPTTSARRRAQRRPDRRRAGPPRPARREGSHRVHQEVSPVPANRSFRLGHPGNRVPNLVFSPEGSKNTDNPPLKPPERGLS